MKVSTLIKDITEKATGLFGTTDHINDCIYVGIFLHSSFFSEKYYVWLERPTAEELLRGEINEPETSKRGEVLTTMYTEGDTLVSALKELLSQINGSIDFGVDQQSKHFSKV